LAWELEWGPKVEFLKTLQQQHGTEPDALRFRPRLKPWVADYYKAFQILSSSRPIGMGAVGAIPISEMAAYLGLFGVRDHEEREHFIKMMQALDSVYLTHMNKRAEAATEQSKAPRKRR